MAEKTNYFIYLASLSANLIAFGAGSAYSWTSPVLPKLKTTEENPLGEPITTFEESWIASITSVGALLGPTAAGILSEKIGRKRTLLLFALPMLASYLILAFANTITLFYIARFLVGIGCGGSYSVVPNFIGEISEDKNRGFLGCLMTLMITSGLLFNYLVGPFVSIAVLSIGNMVPIILFILTFGIFVPESPYYFLSSNDTEKAEESLKKLRRKSGEDVKKELLLMSSIVNEIKSNQASFRDIWKSKALVRGIYVGIGLMIIQQFSGINAVLGFMQTIFTATGSNISPEYSAIIIGIVQVIATVISLQLIDRLGRRFLLLLSTSGSCVSLIALGVYFFLKANSYNTTSIFWLPILSLVVYILAFNLGLSCVPWAIMGELFPTNLKSLASTIIASFSLSLAFLVTMFFPLVSETLGMAGSFWLFAATCVGGCFFIYAVVPETKGRSVQEIQELLEEKRKY